MSLRVIKFYMIEEAQESSNKRRALLYTPFMVDSEP